MGSKLAREGRFWSINGQVHDNVSFTEPLLRMKLGASYRLELINRTIFEHSIYLHGHKFRVIMREGRGGATSAFSRHGAYWTQGADRDRVGRRQSGTTGCFDCSVLEHKEDGNDGCYRCQLD